MGAQFKYVKIVDRAPTPAELRAVEADGSSLLINVLAQPKSVRSLETGNAWTEGYLRGAGIAPSAYMMVCWPPPGIGTEYWADQMVARIERDAADAGKNPLMHKVIGISTYETARTEDFRP